MASPEDTADALARNLRRLRGERGLTLDELAKRAGISRSMLIQIEQKRVNPTLATLVRLAQALDVGLAELVELGSRRRVRVISRDDVAELWTSPGGGSGRLAGGQRPARPHRVLGLAPRARGRARGRSARPGDGGDHPRARRRPRARGRRGVSCGRGRRERRLLGRRRPLLRQQRYAAPARAS